MIAIINYGVGNLFSLVGSLEHLGIDAVVTSDAEEIRKADRIILPGVGAFEDAKRKLSESGLDKIVIEDIEAGSAEQACPQGAFFPSRPGSQQPGSRSLSRKRR